jgi:hypothetical protein
MGRDKAKEFLRLSGAEDIAAASEARARILQSATSRLAEARAPFSNCTSGPSVIPAQTYIDAFTKTLSAAATSASS